MKQKIVIATTILFFLLSINLIAQADFKQKNTQQNLITFNSVGHTYHTTSSVPYMSQPIELKFMAIKSINAHEDQLAYKKSIAKVHE